MAKTFEMENSTVNTISAGTVIKGDITAQGDFRLDGRLEGNIQLNGKLVVGENGQIKGNIVCQNANVIGHVDGNISVKEVLTLHSTAVVKGDILINKLAIEPGAAFSGTCRMLDELRKENDNEESYTNE
ncbi:MAG: polymer-forming cytoskeletal protein [Bacteroidales bacterium]|nr:polymer-forming cytoskeletal protein [Bacteroidales bacterium]